MIYGAVVIGVLLIAVLLAPFFSGQGGLLAIGATINSPERLESLKTALLQRYLEDEAAHAAGHLSKIAWEKRKAFLTNRYVDASRRLDFLRNVAKEGEA